MNNEDKRAFIEEIQKDITHECFKPCFNLQKLKVD
jgi:hypothetical protein